MAELGAVEGIVAEYYEEQQALVDANKPLTYSEKAHRIQSVQRVSAGIETLRAARRIVRNSHGFDLTYEAVPIGKRAVSPWPAHTGIREVVVQPSITLDMDESAMTEVSLDIVSPFDRHRPDAVYGPSNSILIGRKELDRGDFDHESRQGLIRLQAFEPVLNQVLTLIEVSA